MTIPSPGDLGFPEKFDAWRPAQVEALRLLLSSTKRVKAISAPTGFGKTAVYIAFALLTRKRTCFVTDSRALQDQLMGDFAPCGLVDIRGRRNYKCDLKPDYTCEEGYAARCPNKGSVQCPSTEAEIRAALSMLVVTNYDKWTSARKFGQGMENFEMVVFDEGHEAPAALGRAMTVPLSTNEIEKDLGLSFPAKEDCAEFINWKPWAYAARDQAENQMLYWRERCQEPNPRPTWVKQYLHMRNLLKRLSTLTIANPDNWVVDDAEHGYQFDPVRPARYSEGVLLLKMPDILVVSATLRPKTLYMLGIPKDAFDFWEFESDFNPSDCPIYYLPTLRVDRRAKDLGMLWLRLEQIASRRTDRKGIVHTISYARRDEVIGRLPRFSSALVINPRGEATTGTVEAFKKRGPGTILVSPSVGAGFDFPGRACEWQFVCKIPFPETRSKIMQARAADDPEYAHYQAMNKMVQIFGRGTRFKGDRCENFIVDQHLDWFLPKYAHLAPRWFHGFFRHITVLPAPPPALAA